MISKRHQFALIQFAPGYTYSSRQEMHYRYLMLAYQDFEETYRALYKRSRPLNPAPEQLFEFSKALDVNVFVKRSPTAGFHVVCSFGMLLALDDLFMRLVCNDAFFSTDPGGRLWRGCVCHWLTDYGYQPRARYENYEEDDASLAIDNLRGHLGLSQSSFAPVNGSKALARFFSGVAAGDEERISLAEFMFEVAFLWIVLHEEGHYYYGHLHYQGAIKKGAMLSERDKNADISTEMNKVFEWQADDLATANVVDVILRNANLDRLPEYCRRSKIWLLRLVQVSIGCVLLVIQKSRLRQGLEDDYPSVPTRLGSIFVSSCRWLLDKSNTDDALSFSFVELQASWGGALLDIWNAEGLMPVMQPLESDGRGGNRPAMSKDNIGVWNEPWEMFAFGFALGIGRALTSPQEVRSVLGKTVSQLQARDVAKRFYEKWLLELNAILDVHPKVLETLAPFRREARPV